MTNIAILGFGVVGGGTAELISKNRKEVESLGGDAVNIKYILDLRDFPDSPFSDKIVHDYNVILNDPEVSVICELMGGSHPAYEYTLAALKAGKNVVTSNKEVVANFGDEFLKVANENGVAYRFEAAVGGGIPVISPLISFIKQNNISEIRGILNGTTNYILTKMFTLGDSFDSALADAQARGYAERNPDADVLGLDAARKISILGAITTGTLVAEEKIYTEGITGIRSADVRSMEKIGFSIKLVGRCQVKDGKLSKIFVAPFALNGFEPLSSVTGVYNAIEILGEPIGNVMFYGKGAGAGATASAVVGDVVQIMRTAGNYAQPSFVKGEPEESFSDFSSRHYLAFDKANRSEIINAFPECNEIESEECAVITASLSESELSSILASLSAKPLSHIRVL